MSGFLTLIARFCKWGGAFIIPLWCGCATHLTVPETAIKPIATQTVGKSYWLKQSLYAGPFYDDRRFRLTHPRKFEELTYVQSPEGKPILPPPANEILPVGLSVRVVKIEWPTTERVLRRPLFSPRFTPWVFLEVARERDSALFPRKRPYILLMPGGIRDEKSFMDWFRTIFSTTDTNDWLVSLPDDHQKAIIQKRAILGMTSQELEAALGQPDQLTTKPGTEIAAYGKQAITLENGVVIKIN